MRSLAVLVLLAALAPAAGAVRPTSAGRADAKRFGFDRAVPVQRAAPSAAARRAFERFNAGSGGRWSLRFSPRTGLPASVIGGPDVPRPGRPEDAGRQFLAAHQDLLGVDPAVLGVERVVAGPGHRHVLYRQSWRGIPVEFAAVKVHLDERGAVLGVHSSFEPAISLPTVPSVAPDAAARAAAADAGASAQVRDVPTLVIVPLETTGRDHLAWKMRVDGPGGGWRYYVDALTGQVLLRYQIDRFVGPCVTSGTVMGQVYDVDPSTTPGPSPRPFNNQYVWVADGSVVATTTFDSTFGNGFFCAPLQGKVAMSLQGPYVNVGEFRGINAHYDNGNGAWSTVATPVSSPHPYQNSSVAVSTIDLTLAAPSAVSFLPVFQSFAVGSFSGGSGEGSGDIVDDDQLFVYDGNDNPVASYIGARGAFRGAEVHGKRLHVALRSNASGVANGYDVAISSYLALQSPFTWGAAGSSHTWVPADTSQGLRGELDLFYHLNKMHDYFYVDGGRPSAPAPIVVGGQAPVFKPAVAMTHVGPNLVNAFYDPDYDDLYFGDVNNLAPSDVFTDDATVPHHEYVHYVVEKIWSIQNFGQAGAISEGNADYFSASSLDDSHIGNYVCSALCASTPLREIDDALTGPSGYNFYLLGDPQCGAAGHSPCWSGEIHDDSLFVSEALWDVRRFAIGPTGLNLGHDVGRSCADGLEFQSLLYFPESFAELYEAMLQVDRLGAVASCGGANAMQTYIRQAFSQHGLVPIGGDAYDPNGGFETAVDISTLGPVSATLYPAADTDFWSFGAGPGLVQVTLSLPSAGGGLSKAYQLNLYNSARQLVANAQPPYDGFGTIDGICGPTDCNTTASKVVLQYNNPRGGLLYVQVVGGTAQYGSNSGVNSATPYVLSVQFPQAQALSANVVTASFDNDVIAFTVNVSTFVSKQDWRFAFAQLRNEAFAPIPNTATHVPAQTGDYLTMVSSANAGGLITGAVKLQPGFAARFPAVGTVYLEVFGYNLLHSTSTVDPPFAVNGSSTSLGLSNALNLSSVAPELTAYNNLFNPLQGQRATVKYAVNGSGRLTIKLYTITGRHVATLFDDQVQSGKGAVDWDGRNTNGSVVASGVYVVRADGPGLRTTQKIAVVK